MIRMPLYAPITWTWLVKVCLNAAAAPTKHMPAGARNIKKLFVSSSPIIIAGIANPQQKKVNNQFIDFGSL